MENAQNKAQQLINDNVVMVFSKSYCPYCNTTKGIFDKLGVKYGVYELNQESDGEAVQDALEKMTGQRTVPNIFIGKNHIGGNSDLERRACTDLEELLKEAGGS